MTAALLALLLLPQPERVELNVGGVTRVATVFWPAEGKGPIPLVFGFHGHGGNMGVGVRRFKIQDSWPDAGVVYMQGIPTKSSIDPEGRANGWQMQLGDSGDQDIKFFDAMLAWAKSHRKIDLKRVYCMGHSNGGFFTYLLWKAHPDLFAAIAPVAGGLRGGVGDKPIPVLHIAGDVDNVVPYASQVRSVERMKEINACSGDGKRWEIDGCTMWDSKSGAPVAIYTFHGGHMFPQEASDLIVKFFKAHPKR